MKDSDNKMLAKEDVEKLGVSFAGGDVKWYSHSGE